MPLSGVLANIPGYGGYRAASEQNQQEDLAQLQQLGGLQGILAQQQKSQMQQQALAKEEKLRGILSQLPPDATPEMVTKAITPYVGADTLMRTLQSSQDRQAAMTQTADNRTFQADQARALQGDRLTAQAEAAKQRSLDMSLSQTERLQARQDMIRLAASLRPPRPGPADKIPMGYRTTAAGNLEAIPGGPADTKQQGALNQDTAALQSMQSDLDRLAGEANRLKEHPGLPKATGAMSMVPGVGGVATIPGTDAANFKAGLDTLKSQVAFGVLQNMRNNSKTGGALGQVSDKEGQLLQANLAALSTAQSSDEFNKALGRIIKYTDSAKERLRNAYNMKHGDKPTAAVGSPATSVDALLEKYK